MTKNPILSRYELTENGCAVIDVSVRSIEELYENFDRTATYLKKDLDQDFVDYLIDCVREIGEYGFLIRISHSKPESQDHMERVRDSIKNYFEYLQELETREFKILLRKSLWMFALGLGLVTLSISVDGRLSKSGTLPYQLFIEGLTVVSWVSLWEAFSTFFFKLPSYYQNTHRYRRIMLTQVTFRQLHDIHRDREGHIPHRGTPSPNP
jgi:hypothetical protein